MRGGRRCFSALRIIILFSRVPNRKKKSLNPFLFGTFTDQSVPEIVSTDFFFFPPVPFFTVASWLCVITVPDLLQSKQRDNISYEFE